MLKRCGLVCVKVTNSIPSTTGEIFSDPKSEWSTRISVLKLKPDTWPFVQCSLPKILLTYTFAGPIFIVTPIQTIGISMGAEGGLIMMYVQEMNKCKGCKAFCSSVYSASGCRRCCICIQTGKNTERLVVTCCFQIAAVLKQCISAFFYKGTLHSARVTQLEAACCDSPGKCLHQSKPHFFRVISEPSRLCFRWLLSKPAATSDTSHNNSTTDRGHWFAMDSLPSTCLGVRSWNFLV